VYKKGFDPLQMLKCWKVWLELAMREYRRAIFIEGK